MAATSRVTLSTKRVARVSSPPGAALEPTLRQATVADLPAINAVIAAAVMRWDLPERVKRLALPSYRYDAHDLTHLQLWIADSAQGLVGVAALETLQDEDQPEGRSGLLLHGLYVHPEHQHQGIGTRLLHLAEQQVRERGFDGLLVKAQSDAGDFFAARGMQVLKANDHQRDYQYRYWKPLSGWYPG